jgi:hypothetical protein
MSVWRHKDWSVYVSDKPHKKYYAIKDGTSKKIHFGDNRYQQYKDKIGYYKNLDHNDVERRKRYLARSRKIKDKNGRLTINNPDKANFWSANFLW